jgi:hypothetical protein
LNVRFLIELIGNPVKLRGCSRNCKFCYILKPYATVHYAGWEGGLRENEPGDLPDAMQMKAFGKRS